MSVPTTFDKMKDLVKEQGYDGEIAEDAEDNLEESSDALDLLSSGQAEEDGTTDLAQEEDSQLEAETSESEREEASDGPPEFVQVTDERGRQRKLKVDSSKIEKYATDAYNYQKGMRKFQAERDDIKKNHTELQKHWETVEGAYKDGGIAGLINLLEDDDSAYSRWERQQQGRWEKRYNASDEELAELDRQEVDAKERQQKTSAYKEMEDRLAKLEQDKEHAELQALEAQVNPVFEKYSFKGKLGDTADEDMFDELLWDRSLKLLEPYEEAGALTPQIIRTTMRDTARAISKRLAKQGKTAAKKQVAKAKEEAGKNIQAKARKAMPTGKDAEEARDLLSKGDIGGIFRNFGKYRKNLGI